MRYLSDDWALVMNTCCQPAESVKERETQELKLTSTVLDEIK